METEKKEQQLLQAVAPGSALAIAMSDKNAMQTLGSIFVAKQMPRNIADVEAKIKTMCAHERLAQKAFFSYKRGGTEITGETIHLANACMTAYGNIDAGWSKTGELVNEKGIVCSMCEAYCFDKENNIIRKASFLVPHYREVKNHKDGGYVLKSDRDIYELCANMAARRMRACIFGVIPEFVKSLASEQCEKTLARGDVSMEERIKNILEKYSAIGVTREMLEEKIGCSMEEATPNNFIFLGKLYNALTSNIVSVEDQFGEENKDEKKTPTEPIFKKKKEEEEVIIDVDKLEEPTENPDLFKTPFDE